MNNAKKMALCCVCILPLAITIACVDVRPTTFVKSLNTEWTTIPLKQGVTPEQAWNRALDIVMSKYDMEMINKDAFYARSSWSSTVIRQGGISTPYRTRVVFRLSPEKDALYLKVEAQYGGEGKWIIGYDANVLETIKQDITIIIGR